MWHRLRREAPSEDRTSRRETPANDCTSRREAPLHDRSSRREAPADDRSSRCEAPSDDRTPRREAPAYDRTSRREAPSDDRASRREAPSDDRASRSEAPSDDRASRREAPSDDRGSRREAPADDRSSRRQAPADAGTQHSAPDCEVRGVGSGIDPRGDDRKFRHMDRLRELDANAETSGKSTDERLLYLMEETSGSSSAGRKVASLLISCKDDDQKYSNPHTYLSKKQSMYERDLPDARAELTIRVIKAASNELRKLHECLVNATVRQPLGNQPPGFPPPQLSARMSRCLPVRIGPVAQDAVSRRDIRHACMEELLGSDGAMAMQQATDDVADYARSGFASMYSVKKPNRRGRLLPAAQLGAARDVVHGKLRAKAMRSGASAPLVHGYAPSHSHLGESEDDSDDGGRRQGGGVDQHEPPALPAGDARSYQRLQPANGSELVGWPVMALFAEYGGQPYEDQKWHKGVVVMYMAEASNPYVVFFEMDSIWEAMDFPDETVIFRKGRKDDICIHITDDMMPGAEDLE